MHCTFLRPKMVMREGWRQSSDFADDIKNMKWWWLGQTAYTSTLYVAVEGRNTASLRGPRSRYLWILLEKMVWRPQLFRGQRRSSMSETPTRIFCSVPDILFLLINDLDIYAYVDSTYQKNLQSSLTTTISVDPINHSLAIAVVRFILLRVLINIMTDPPITFFKIHTRSRWIRTKKK